MEWMVARTMVVSWWEAGQAGDTVSSVCPNLSRISSCHANTVARPPSRMATCLFGRRTRSSRHRSERR